MFKKLLRKVNKLEAANYLLLCVCFYLSIQCLISNLDLEGTNYLSVQMRRFTDAMLFALPVLFLRRKRFIIPYLCLVSLYLLSIPWYYRTYETIMPLSSYLMIENLNGLQGSIIASMRIKDLLQVLPIVLYIVVYALKWEKNRQKIGKTQFAICAIGLCWMIFFTSLSYLAHDPNLYSHPYGLFKHEPIRSFKQLGFIHFWNIQLAGRNTITNAERAEVLRFFKDQKQVNHPKETGTLHTKNLIVILVESFNSWTIGQTVNGIEITPHINRLLQDSCSLYFPYMLPQVKDGRSSDAQLLMNTGLLPLNSGAASSKHFNNTFFSLPKSLKEKGYVSISLLCDDKIYWNQATTSKSYGFDCVYDKLEDDGKLFSQAPGLLQKTPQPFYAQLVTMSMHGPDYPTTNSPLNRQEFADQEVKEYSIATQYTDSCIGRFIENLKEKDLYNNSTIVITGDHNAVDFNRMEGRSTSLLVDRYIPFIVLNTTLRSANQNKVVAQVDIYPTLLGLMGCSDYAWQGLGEDLCSPTVSGCAFHHTGEMAGTPLNDRLKEKRRKIWEISDIMIRMDYFKHNQSTHAHYIAHGGGKIENHTYTNSLEAVLHSIDRGFKYIEMDLSLTTDSQLVAVHDWPKFHKLTGHPGDSCAISLAEFKSRKILGKYTPMSHRDIDSMWHVYPQLFLVTDKISDPLILSNSFNRLKHRMLVEAFSYEDYVALKEAGFLCPMLSGSGYKSIFIKQRIKHLFDNENPLIECFTMSKENYEQDWKFQWVNKLYGSKVALFTVSSKEEGEKYLQKGADWVYID